MTTRTKNQSAAVLAGNHGFSLISNEKLLQLYSTMVKCRMIGERVRTLFDHGERAGKRDAAVGQEAAVVGVTIDLLADDTTAPSHPGFMVDFIRGASLAQVFRSQVFRSLRGASAGPNRIDPDRIRPDRIRPAIDAQLTAAMDAARENKLKKNGNIVVAFTGDGSRSSGSWQKALRLAGSRQLPILFVGQNRFVGLNERTSEAAGLQPQAGVGDFLLDAQACGLPGIPVDGNDVVAVYRVATEAIAQARKGSGPTLIECTSFPGRDRSSLGSGQADDCILNMETYLARKGLFREEFKSEVGVGFTRELHAALGAAERGPFPAGSDVFDGPAS
jgi:pyruvate dehydrogenase E1 component alpha subunit